MKKSLVSYNVQSFKKKVLRPQNRRSKARRDGSRGHTTDEVKTKKRGGEVRTNFGQNE